MAHTLVRKTATSHIPRGWLLLGMAGGCWGVIFASWFAFRQIAALVFG
jgi:hypothetical protein